VNAAELRERVRDRWHEFRARSIYFQLKVLVLVCYGVLVAGTLLWAPPSSAAKNQIGASILVLEGDMVVGRYIVVENQSRTHWKGVRFSIDDGYTVDRDLVQAGEKVTLYVRDFKKKVIRKRRGREIPRTVAAPPDMVPTGITVECSEGMAFQPLPASNRSPPAGG
jgi:hypothetical protein